MSEMNPSDEHADSVFYGIAVEEVQAGRVDKGLMAKAIAKAYGDKKKAEVLYLEWRVGLLKEESLKCLKKEEAATKEKLSKEAAEKFNKVWGPRIQSTETIVCIVIVVVTICFVIFVMSS